MVATRIVDNETTSMSSDIVYSEILAKPINNASFPRVKALGDDITRVSQEFSKLCLVILCHIHRGPGSAAPGSPPGGVAPALSFSHRNLFKYVLLSIQGEWSYKLINVFYLQGTECPVMLLEMHLLVREKAKCFIHGNPGYRFIHGIWSIA